MKTEQELQEELSDLRASIRLRDKGLIHIEREKHRLILRKIEFLEEVLEIET